MAMTDFPVNSPLAVQLWAKRLAVEAYNQTWFRRFVGNDANSVIQMKEETSKNAGTSITIGLRMQFQGAGVLGDGILEGTEEALLTYADTVYINQLRLAVSAGGRMSQQRVPFALREECRAGLADWWARRLDYSFFNQIGGNTLETDVRFTGNNATIAPDTDHLLLPSGVANEGALTSSNTFNIQMIDDAVEAAQMLSANGLPVIRPLRINGEDKYVIFLHPFQVTDLRTNTNTGQWLDIEKAAMTGGQVTKNPIYTGALGEYNGTIIHNAYRLPQGIYNGAAVSNVYRAVFCGAQACVLAYGRGDSKERFTWVEEVFDYGNILGVSAGTIFGLKKLTFNSADFGCITMPTWAEKHTSIG